MSTKIDPCSVTEAVQTLPTVCGGLPIKRFIYLSGYLLPSLYTERKGRMYFSFKKFRPADFEYNLFSLALTRSFACQEYRLGEKCGRRPGAEI